jgi:hypothetical protein
MKIKHLKNLLGKKNEFYGYSFKEISDAERRLKIKLPIELKEVYQQFGRNAYINGYNYFVPPSNLKIRNNRLTFFIENQACYSWFYDVNEIQKGIYNIYGQNDEGEIKLVDNNLENFLIRECCIWFEQHLFKCKIIRTEISPQSQILSKNLINEIRHSSNDNKTTWYWTDDMEIVAYKARKDGKFKWNIFTQNELELSKILIDFDRNIHKVTHSDSNFKVKPKPLNVLYFEEEEIEKYRIRKPVEEDKFTTVTITPKHKISDFDLPF